MQFNRRVIRRAGGLIVRRGLFLAIGSLLIVGGARLGLELTAEDAHPHSGDELGSKNALLHLRAARGNLQGIAV